MVSLTDALQTALQHHQAGRLPEAEALYRQILQVQPHHPDALHMLGVIASQVGRHDVAIEYISRAIALNPLVAEFHSNLGHTRLAQGLLEEAVTCYRRALALRPDFAETYNNLGNALKEQGKLEEAITCYQQVLTLQPANGAAYYNLGNTLREQGKLEEAKRCYQLALALKPDYAMAYNNLGTVFGDQDRQEEAKACYERALAIDPDHVMVLNNLGGVFREQGRLEEAKACYERALATNGDHATLHYNLGNVFMEQGRLEEAKACYEQALALKPDYAEAENQFMHQLQHFCDWGQLEKLIEHQKQLACTASPARIAPFTFLCIPTSPAEQLTCARNFVSKRFSRIVRLREGLGFEFKRTPKPTLRIGYLSADFRQHAIAYLIAELFELHNRNCVEVFAYSIGPDDGSEIRKRLARACDRFVDIRALSSVEAARRMYGDGIDLLVDLGGHTAGARTEIAALRPAPIQVNYPYTGTMGAEFIDYIITDRFITPPDQEPYFSEKCVYLPDCYQINDRKRTIARRTPTRKECGLPEKGFVFCCFNNSYKITPAVFDVWMRLLKNVPGSVLWLLEANSRVAANLRREAKVRGANPDRLVFAPRMPLEKHLARHRVADLFLDTVPYNAHATASDALWVGLPVLTCAGETFASRVAGSLLTAIGLPELITRSLADYEALALRLARHPGELAGLRKRVAKNRLTAPLFDSERFTQHLERAYQTMWEIYLKGEAPKRIEVPALQGRSKR